MGEFLTGFLSGVASSVIVGVLSGAWKKLRDARMNRVLLDLALHRGEGIELRNSGRGLSAEQRADWIARAKTWESEAGDKASRLSRVEGEQIRNLDHVEVLDPLGIADREQLRMLQNVNETLKRLNDVIQRHLTE